jgi:Domain of Unknown Function (DUF1080)
MKIVMLRTLTMIVSCSIGLVATAFVHGDDESGWIELIGEDSLGSWRKPTGDWMVAGDAELKADNPKLLAPKPGRGTIINGKTGRTTNLLSSQDFGDLEAHFEFLVPKGSNSGVKFEGFYEIQIADSFGVKEPTGSHCGGIYPRAEMLPKYHHIDDGTPPLLNASRKPGDWQTLDVTFRTPRFARDGTKVENARFVKVVLNGQMIHENVDVKSPTGHVWRLPEVAKGPILLQGDHGPVAFRKIRIRAL